MADHKAGHSPLQAFFLLRAARLSLLHDRYGRHQGVPDARTALVAWALRSTLEDCVPLGIEDEALALVSPPEDRWFRL